MHGSSRQSRVSNSSLPRWHKIDLQTEHEVHALFRTLRPQFVFHFSSLATASRDVSLVIPTLRAEVVATVNLLLAATESGCRRIVLPASLEEPQAGAAPTSPYAAAKAATRAYASMFYTLYKTPVRLARIYMAYGPGQTTNKVIPQLIQALLRGKSPVLASPQRLTDWIYIDDVVEGLIAVAAAEGIDGQSFELGSGQLVSIREVASRLQRVLNCDLPVQSVTGTLREGEIERCADLDPTEQMIGWRPRVSLEDGLQRTVDAIRQELASQTY